jgi:hypothetical protein
VIVSFIDEHRATYGVEPICAVLPIAPATYYAHKALQREPEKRSVRAKRDEVLRCEIRRVHAENFAVYGAEKIWRQLGLDEWRARRDTHRTKYEAAKARAAAHEETLRRIQELEARLTEIETVVGTKAQQLAKVGDPGTDFVAARGLEDRT